MKWVYRKLRSFGIKLYNKFYYILLIKIVISKLKGYVSNRINRRKDLNVVKDLKALIASAKASNQPIFVQFPIISWSLSLFQRPQQFAKAMSKLGYLTIYLYPSSSERYSLHKISPNLYLSNICEILKDLQGAIISVYLNYPLENNLDKYLTENFFKNNKVFCEHVDHIDEQISGKYFAKVLQQRFKAIKNLAFAFLVGTSRTLYQELVEHYPDQHIIYLPNGVDPQHFMKNNIWNKRLIFPDKIQKAFQQNRKIIGFFGAIAPWIWDELIVELATKRPEYFILMIGPESGNRPPFPKRENIYLTGTVNYEDLPFYARHFDVSIIPFRLGSLAKATSPVKLFEYFAIGKPIVVTSDLVECIQFEGVEHASTPDQFIEKIDRALELGNLTLQKKYYHYADKNSWVMRAKNLQNIIKN